MHTSLVQAPVIMRGDTLKRFIIAFVSIVLIFVGAMFSAIRVRLVALEALTLSTQAIEERTVHVTFDTPVLGTGWSESEGAFIWSIAPSATLNISIIPGWYRIEFEAAS